MQMQIGFEGCVAVITGAGRGLGRAYALEFARRGARVVVNDFGSPDRVTPDGDVAAELVQDIRRSGGEAIISRADVSNPDEGRSIIELALSTWGRVDIVVSNAGVMLDRTFAKASLADLHLVLDSHLWGAIHVARPAFEVMKSRGDGGRIVLTSSTAGLYGGFGQSAYSAAKAGIIGLTKALALEGSKYGIKVNAVAPIATTRLTPPGRSQDLRDLFDVSRVTPLVMALSHDTCPGSGEVFICGGGVIKRAVVALSEGVSLGEHTPEEIAASWTRIRRAEAGELPDALSIVDEFSRARLKGDAHG